MDLKYLYFRIEENIAIIELANEKKKNALCYDLLYELNNLLQEIEDNDEARTVILTGRGENFCSGMDVEWLFKEDSIGMRNANRWIQRIFNYLEHYKKPTIAALNGITLGAGLMLALNCDLRIASPNALLGLPEIKIGIPLFLGGPKILQRYLGVGKIKELSLLGNLFNAQKGMELGLINKVVSKNKLSKESKCLAREICSLNPIALEMLKGSINASYEMSEKAVLAYELDSLAFYWGTKGRKDGLKSFLKKESE